jgi:membrane protein YqaA with SNARE-associated domain
VSSLFRFFLTWWGAILMGALDSSLLFFLPFGIDALVVYLAARNAMLFWLYPILATLGSVAGAGVTFGIGVKAGENGLERLVSKRRLDRMRKRLERPGALATAIPALMPPPFPMTPFILTAGALGADATRFMATFGTARLVRFGAEAVLARVYGSGILRVLQSDTVHMVIIGFIVIAVIGTLASAVVMWRNTRQPRMSPA